MRIVGPGSTGNWGTLAAGGAIGPNDALNAWQLGYSYFAVNSANTPGVSTPSLWDGLNFNPNTLGNYQFEIAVRKSQYGPIVGSTAMTVSVVPAPGAIAVLGLAGLSVRRRRN
jgi:MYXO-CTERM domain-containing protein